MLARLAFALAAIELAAAPVMPAIGANDKAARVIPVCGSPGHTITVPVKGKHEAPARDCPSACHALCARRLGEDNDGQG
ncbi:MAG: hypothetical protein C0500_04265 [Sphingobium sp.]|nr:hypothetical protein [Sphingobium sp.]